MDKYDTSTEKLNSETITVIQILCIYFVSLMSVSLVTETLLVGHISILNHSNQRWEPKRQAMCKADLMYVRTDMGFLGRYRV